MIDEQTLRDWLRKSRELGWTHKDEYLKELGAVLRDKRRTSEAISTLHETIRLLLSVDDHYMVASAYNILAEVYDFHLHDNVTALRCIEHAIAHASIGVNPRKQQFESTATMLRERVYGHR